MNDVWTDPAATLYTRCPHRQGSLFTTAQIQAENLRSLIETFGATKESNNDPTMCERHATLLSKYQKAVATFSSTLTALEEARATLSRDEYQRIAGYVDQARIEAEHARIELERHIEECGCFPSVHAPQS